MSAIKKEILEKFATASGDGAYELKSTGAEYRAWVIKNMNMYGVAIEYDGNDINETFASTALQNIDVELDGEYKELLFLFSADINNRETFATICTDFAEPGEKGRKRDFVKEYPFKWWSQWRELLGNTKSDKKVYDIIGELMAVCRLIKDGKKPLWAAIGKGSHDIETKDYSYEVKSTLKKESSTIHISSQFQLDYSDKLYLVFNRMEKSVNGESINKLMDEIKRLDSANYADYEKYLESSGFPKGSHYRTDSYRLLERRLYIVDDNFPRIIEQSFAGGSFPKAIVHIEYDINLDGIPYKNWNI